ncbi:MAG TPA: replication endonuclease [Burkholderiaceae bacterium]|nr:replication endonuclease [Burkholderiaceae bacterium]
MKPYGFRISEPQHDGTPHWHLLLFCPPEQVESLVETMQYYALEDSPDEAGAAQHRCDVKMIDKSRGTAAGYIAKYVAKNIDGKHVGEDLNGKPATESAKRVEAWASTWRIRQFQQIGGPPVGVWRELRRVKTLPANAPAHLQQAHRAANKQVQRDGDERATVAWDDYCAAQGGVECGREAQITLAMADAEQPGRYGDSASIRPIGVKTFASGEAAAGRLLVVESSRRTWVIETATVRRFDSRSFSAEAAQPPQPWTGVNNCTELNFPIGGSIDPIIHKEGKATKPKPLALFSPSPGGGKTEEPITSLLEPRILPSCQPPLY